MAVFTDLTNMLHKPKAYFQATRDEMLKYIPKNVQTTLEFGCGCGGFFKVLREKLDVETWGVEIDKESAQKAQTEMQKIINLDAIEALKEIPENYFDCVILFDVLEHLVNPYYLLDALKINLTKDGVIVASIPNVRYYRNLINFAIKGNWDYKDHGILDKTHLRFFTRNSIIKMFNQLNFEILKLEGIHPTSSTTFKLLNLIFPNMLSDARYRQFAVVVKLKPENK
jgi:2-polyprenyl-3-methyl-5-hydroxy-6-metoxy-1,4-benzoquinol methylase